MPSHDSLSGFARLKRATRVGIKALVWAAREEEAVRLELIGLVVLIPLGIWLGHSGVERVVLCLSALLVLIVELLNTGLEVAVDRIGTEQHELSGLAKDLGSAAVMIALFVAALSWALILIR
ncbi:MAG TPA: diacylglycerol kinase [Gammaproteobacteria bacterium]|nr:diacylglycerol kinase [Gammaproteobacteria bacterium]